MPHTELTMNTHCCIQPHTRDIEQRSKTSPGSAMTLTYNFHSSLTRSGKRPPQEQTPPCRHVASHLQKKAPLSPGSRPGPTHTCAQQRQREFQPSSVLWPRFFVHYKLKSKQVKFFIVFMPSVTGHKNENAAWGSWLAQSLEHQTPDVEVVSSSPTLV